MCCFNIYNSILKVENIIMYVNPLRFYVIPAGETPTPTTGFNPKPEHLILPFSTQEKYDFSRIFFFLSIAEYI